MGSVSPLYHGSNTEVPGSPTSTPHMDWMACWDIQRQFISDELQGQSLNDGVLLMGGHYHDSEELIRKLKAIITRYPGRMFFASHRTMDACIGLIAWGQIDTLNEVDKPHIMCLIAACHSIDHQARSQEDVGLAIFSDRSSHRICYQNCLRR